MSDRDADDNYAPRGAPPDDGVHGTYGEPEPTDAEAAQVVADVLARVVAVVERIQGMPLDGAYPPLGLGALERRVVAVTDRLAVITERVADLMLRMSALDQREAELSPRVVRLASDLARLGNIAPDEEALEDTEQVGAQESPRTEG